MVKKVCRQISAAVWSATARQRAMIRRQFTTRNRRMALGLGIAVIGIGIGVVIVPGDWMSPGVMILPILVGGLLLWPRALRILFGVVAVMVAYDWLNGKKAGLGIIATIVLTAAFAALLARTRAKLGMKGLRGDRMLIELRDRIRAQGRMPELPDGW